MNKPLYYMLFFYGGGLFYQCKDKIKEKTKTKNVVLLWLLFFVALIFINKIMDVVGGANYYSMVMKGAFIGLKNLLKASLAWIGIYAFYTSAVVWCRRHTASDLALKIGMCGYGVYVFHQFVLVWLYEYTSFPKILGTYWTPWVSFVFTTLVSLQLTLIIRKTKLGRKFL